MATITIDERLQTRVTKIPALENVRVEDPHLRSFLESMKEIIEIRENRRGHADDRFISYRELVELLDTDETAVSSIDHGSMAGLSDDDHTLYLLASGGRALTANWDAGSFKITAETFESDVATGTAPFTVASTTVVTNLNADYLDGQHGSYYAVDSEVLKKDGSVALTANWDAGGYEIRAETFESDVATGTAPLTIASTTLVTNLNADLLDGQHASYFSAVTNVVLRDGSQALTADWDAGSFKITAQQFESDIATGTAPFIVASTTVVTNLNADKLDGYDATDITYSFVSGNDAGTDVSAAELETLSDGSNADALHVHTMASGISDESNYLLAAGSRALTGNWDAGSFKITAQQLESDVATGTAPLVVASTTLVTNLNADYLDGQHGSYYAVAANVLLKDGSVALTSNWDAGSFKITAETFESDVATGTAPFTVASTTVVTNLNADKLDGYDASDIDYSFVSGNDGDTDVTGAQLEELTDGSETTLHSHAGSSESYARLIHRTAAGTNHGGTATSGSWQTRPITHEVRDDDGICSLSSNQITLGAGTYRVHAIQDLIGCGRVAARLRDITNSTTLLVGQTAYCEVSSPYGGESPIVVGIFTLAGTAAIELQYYCNTTRASYGIGYAANTGEINIFATVEIWKIS